MILLYFNIYFHFLKNLLKLMEQNILFTFEFQKPPLSAFPSIQPNFFLWINKKKISFNVPLTQHDDLPQKNSKSTPLINKNSPQKETYRTKTSGGVASRAPMKYWSMCARSLHLHSTLLLFHTQKHPWHTRIIPPGLGSAKKFSSDGKKRREENDRL